MQTVKTKEIDRVVAALDETRHSEFFRNPDRPDGRFVRERRGRQHPDVLRAQARIRTAHWRNKMDRKRAPTTQQICMSLLVALVTSNLNELTERDHGLVGKMLLDLQSRGFSIVEAKATLRRLRNRMVDPDDRAGEPGETTGPALQLSAWGNPASIF
jgi:hypothetical protein